MKNVYMKFKNSRFTIPKFHFSEKWKNQSKFRKVLSKFEAKFSKVNQVWLITPQPQTSIPNMKALAQIFFLDILHTKFSNFKWE